MSRSVLVSIIAVAVVVVAVLAFVFLRPKPTEVTTVVAESETTGPSLGNAVLNASGYVVARRMSTVSSKVTGKIAEIFVEEGMAVERRARCWRASSPTNSRTMLTMAQRELEASQAQSRGDRSAARRGRSAISSATKRWCSSSSSARPRSTPRAPKRTRWPRASQHRRRR